MANIPIEKKSGTPWWLYLLGALLLLGLLGLLTRGCDDNDATTADGIVEDSLAAGGEAGIDSNIGDSATAGVGNAFSSVDDVFADTTNLSGTIGREVTFNNVRVTDVVGDSTFYATAANGQRLFVVLEGLGEGETGGTADGQQAIRNGDTVSLSGRIESATGRDFSTYGRQSADTDRIGRQGIYLRARRVVEGAMGAGATGTN